MPALVFGVAIGNVLQGVPFSLDSDMRATYHADTLAGLLGLFSPFTVLCGVVSVSMLALQGAAWLSMKLTRGNLRDRALGFGVIAALAVMICFALGYVFIRYGGLGYRVSGDTVTSGPSNPTYAVVIPAAGAWLANFAKYPWMWAGPALGFAGPLLALLGLKFKSEFLSFGGSSLGIVGIISTVGLSMFPIILPSSVDMHSSLLVWNASSSHLTLFIMLIVTLIFLPIVLYYTGWVYKVLFGRVSVDDLKTNPDLY